MGVGFNSSGSSSSSAPRDAGGGVIAGIINAALGLDQNVRNGQFSLINNLTGLKSDGKPLKKKGLKREEERRELQLAGAGSPFGEGTPGFDIVSNLLSGITDPVKFGAEFEALVNQSVDAQQDIFGKSADALSQLISSGGNPTDVSALVSQGVNQLQEQFSTSGAGLFSSDVQNASVRLGSELNVGAQESAQNRLLNALGLGQTFAQSQQRFANNLGNLGQQFDTQFTKGGRARSALTSLAVPGSNIFSIGADTESSSRAFGANASLSTTTT